MNDRDFDELEDSEDEEDVQIERVVYRGEGSDPLFGLLIAGAVSIGLIPLIGSDAADMRYTLAWGLLAVFGVLAWLLGSTERVEQENPENLAWGIAFGLILGVPLLAFASGTLIEATKLLFQGMNAGSMLAYVVFVMPLAETLFFRNLLQDGRTFWGTAMITTVWQMVLFFPLINHQAYPLIMGVVFLMANMMYGYVRERNGLAAAWLCQIIVNLTILFLPFSDIF